MFIGHYSAAFAAAAHPKAPGLAPLFVAAQLVDFGFFGLTLAGIEHLRLTPGTSAMNPMDLYDMPLTHSLVGTLVWAAGFAVAVRALAGTWVAGLISALVVVSHWLLDVLVHVPDMTIAGGAPKLGLGLWNHPAIEMPLEVLLVLGTAALFWLSRGFAGRRLPVLVLVLLVMQAINWFGPQPTEGDVLPLPVIALMAYVLATGLAAWTDERPRPAPAM